MNLSHQLFQILDLYKVALNQQFRQHQIRLSPLHYKVLQLIQQLNPATPQFIAQKSGRDKAQVSRLLQDMEKQGLIEKQPHPTDKRSVCLGLTHQAQQLYQQASAQVQWVDQQMSACLSAEQQQQLQQLLNQLQQGFCPNE